MTSSEQDALIAGARADQTRRIVEFIGPHFMGAHVNAGVVAAAIWREFGTQPEERAA